jgi:hypothetical protein
VDEDPETGLGNSIDDDGDTSVDNAHAPVAGSDCDGFSDADEVVIGTCPNVACGANAWPPDFDDNEVINILDVGQLLPPRYGMTSSDPGRDRRYDIVPNGVIDGANLDKEIGFFGLTYTP